MKTTYITPTLFILFLVTFVTGTALTVQSFIIDRYAESAVIFLLTLSLLAFIKHEGKKQQIKVAHTTSPIPAIDEGHQTLNRTSMYNNKLEEKQVLEPDKDYLKLVDNGKNLHDEVFKPHHVEVIDDRSWYHQRLSRK